MALSRTPVAVIGAGASGLPQCKALQDQNIPYCCFEATDRVGGLWSNIETQAGYRSLHINTDIDMTAYADLTMPRDWPIYPTREQLVEYFNAYVDKYTLRENIQFNTRVVRAQRLPQCLPQGGWQLRLRDELSGHERDEYYAALMVANGHHWNQRWPDAVEYERQVFKGRQIHSHEYVDPQSNDLHGKNILIVGAGNSAMDIAVELSAETLDNKVYLSTRTGQRIWPRYVDGEALTKVLERRQLKLPLWLQQRLGNLIGYQFNRKYIGDLRQYGWPDPQYSYTETHPTISSTMAPAVKARRVIPKPGIKTFSANQVSFCALPAHSFGWHSRVETADIDVVVWCTGYNISFPFFDSSVLGTCADSVQGQGLKENVIAAWKRMIIPGVEDLCLLGLFQPLGALNPCVEMQAKIYAAFLAGKLALPTDNIMQQDNAEKERKNRRVFTQNARHTLEESYVDFRRELEDYYLEGQDNNHSQPSARHFQWPASATASAVDSSSPLNPVDFEKV